MELKMKFALFSTLILASCFSHADFLSDGAGKFYIGVDVSDLDGEFEGNKSYIKNSTTMYGGTIGYNLNDIFSTDLFYNESDKYEIKGYGIRLNARKEIYNSFYAVGSFGLGRFEYEIKDKEELQEKTSLDDKTQIKEQLGLGVGYKFDVFTLELKYLKEKEIDGIGGSFHIHF
jgi:hypothetical protein